MPLEVNYQASRHGRPYKALQHGSWTVQNGTGQGQHLSFIEDISKHRPQQGSRVNRRMHNLGCRKVQLKADLRTVLGNEGRMAWLRGNILSIGHYIRRSLHRSSVAAVDSEVCASDEAASARKQEDGRCLEVLWRTKTAEQSACHPRFLDFGLGLQESVGHCCADVLDDKVRICSRAWTDGSRERKRGNLRQEKAY